MAEQYTDKNALYDRIIGSIVTNIMVERARDKDLQIVLRNFDVNDETHRLYFNCAMIVSCLNGNEPIYISPKGEGLFQCWWTYIKLWWKKKYCRRQMRFMTKNVAAEHDTPTIKKIIAYVAYSFQMADAAMERINKEMYGW